MDTTPETTLNHGGTGHQVWLPVRSGDERSHPLQMGIMLNSRGERMTKALEGTEVEQQTPSKWGWETSGEQAVMAFHTRSSVALGDYPRWGGWPLINLITMHNNDLIWFDFSFIINIFHRQSELDNKLYSNLNCFCSKLSFLYYYQKKSWTDIENLFV